MTFQVQPDPEAPDVLGIFRDGDLIVELQRTETLELLEALKLPEQEFIHVCVLDPTPWGWFDYQNWQVGPRYVGGPYNDHVQGLSQFTPLREYCQVRDHYPKESQ